MSMVDSSIFRHLRANLASQIRYLSEDWRRAFYVQSISSEVLAGLTVAAVAIPLNVALAVACGLPASSGLISGAIGGAIAGMLGGSALQVTGPAAALNLMVLQISKGYGPAGVAAACLAVGGIQLLLSLFGAGRLIRFMPESILAGFTTGVGLTLLGSQIPEILGLEYRFADLLEMSIRPSWLGNVSWLAVVCGLFVALMVSTLREFKRIPVAIIAIAFTTILSVELSWNIDRVGAISSAFLWPAMPILGTEKWLEVLFLAIPLGILAGAESLLSAQAVDRMTKARIPHQSNLELMGQGFANFGVGLFGGLPVSGVIVRSSLNAQCGAKTRLSTIIHAAILLLAVLHLGTLLSQIPLAALAGLLCVVGWRLIEVKTLLHLMTKQPVEAVAFLCAAAGTVSGHLSLGLGSGAAVLFVQYARDRKTINSSEIGAVARLGDASAKHEKVGTATVIPDAPRRNPLHYLWKTKSGKWINQIQDKAQVSNSAFVHQKASVIGRVILGDHVHIAAESSVRADEGSPFYIGSNSNIQDGVVIHALKERWISVKGRDWAVYIGECVSVAHQALIHGPCFIGSNTFVGFQSVVHDSIVGSDCYIGIGAIVVGVEIPRGRYVPHGAIIDTHDKADGLQPVRDEHREFNEDVVDVNRGLAAAYRKDAWQIKAPGGSRRIAAKADRF